MRLGSILTAKRKFDDVRTPVNRRECDARSQLRSVRRTSRWSRAALLARLYRRGGSRRKQSPEFAVDILYLTTPSKNHQYQLRNSPSTSKPSDRFCAAKMKLRDGGGVPVMRAGLGGMPPPPFFSAPKKPKKLLGSAASGFAGGARPGTLAVSPPSRAASRLHCGRDLVFCESKWSSAAPLSMRPQPSGPHPDLPAVGLILGNRPPLWPRFTRHV